MTEQLKQEMIQEAKLHIIGLGLRIASNQEAYEHYQYQLEAASLDLTELENIEVI